MPELHARIRVALRHRAALGALVEGVVVRVGALRIDPAGHTCWIDNEHVDLPRRQFALLTLLAHNAGRVVTNTQLMEQVWGDEWSNNIAALRTHIVGLRKVLARHPDAPRIVTDARVGYRMTAPE